MDVALTPLGDAETTTDPGSDVASGLGYGEVSEFTALPPGRYAVSLRAAGDEPTTPPVLSAVAQVRPGAASTVAVTGMFADVALEVLSDDLSAPPAVSARVRVLAAAAGADSLDATLTDGTALAEGLAFPGAADPVTVPAGRTALRLNSGTDLPLDLTAGTVVTLLVLDRPGGGLAVRTVLDAAGVQQVPVGGVEAGGGPDPAAPPVVRTAWRTLARLLPSLVSAPDVGAADPVRLTLPSIGATSPLAGIGLDGSGALVPPADPAVAGWYTGGAVPGEPGPAVIAGHVNWAGEAGALARLDELAVGDPVVVDMADGTSHAFTVSRVERHPKAAFPTAAVYGATPGSELRLITCGGAFDAATGSYADNVVVFAG